MRAKHITILFDATPMASRRKTGVGVYTEGLIAALAAARPDETFVGHYFNPLGRQRYDLPAAPNISYRQSRLLPLKAVNLLRRAGFDVPFSWLIRRTGDFVIFPAFLDRPTPVPMTVLVHDLSFVDVPETLPARSRSDLTRFVPRAIRRASFVTTISETTAGRIRDVYGTATPIVVTPVPPVKPEPVSVTVAGAALGRFGIGKEYVLSVGTLEPRKNIAGLVKAYRQLPTETRERYSLVLAGGSGWQDEGIKAAIDAALADGLDIILPGFVSSQERAALYSGASLFVLPSRYEGFGIPALEAMHYGVPVLCNDIPVLREVCGDAAEYCDAADPAELSAGMKRLLTDEAVRKKLVNTGRQQLKRYSWRDNAERLFDAITRTVGDRP
jgi:glycosyltransferase involved in cell wall biosynthesis